LPATQPALSPRKSCTTGHYRPNLARKVHKRGLPFTDNALDCVLRVCGVVCSCACQPCRESKVLQERDLVQTGVLPAFMPRDLFTASLSRNLLNDLTPRNIDAQLNPCSHATPSTHFRHMLEEPPKHAGKTVKCPPFALTAAG